MTISGNDVVMKKVRIAQLKASLSGYLRAVRRGDTVTVLDRDTPVARIVPIRQPGLHVRKPAPSAPPLNRVPLPPPIGLKLDVLQLLLEERQGQR
jgi:prevent-host-death family protein